MSIKISTGKLELAITFVELVERQVYGNAIELLEIQPGHLDRLAQLPFHHKDPLIIFIANSLRPGLATPI